MATDAIKILTREEILRKIEALTEPGSTVFFYLSQGPLPGGPLGRGAAVIELNPAYPGKKQKKYIIYGAAVEGMQPQGKGGKIFDTDKAPDIAKWVKERHNLPPKEGRY